MLRVGLVGCGNISDIYLTNAALFRDFAITAVSDIRADVASAVGGKYGVEALAFEEMLRRDEIDAVLNLTVPAAHADISLQAIDAGKHVYSEKPLATSRRDALAINGAAAAKGLRVGAAPDTVLGPGMQTARNLLDAGEIGRPISGVSAMMTRGMEHRHPSPDFFFKPGGGPVLDMGPYYIAMMTNLLGPVRSIAATGQMGFAQRIITAPGSPRYGEAIKVEVLTTVQGVLAFECNTQIAFSFSWDVFNHMIAPMELYGSLGSMRLPDPNFFGGPVNVARERHDWTPVAVSSRPCGALNFPADNPTLANYRGLGIAEMAKAIETGRRHRANDETAFHVLDVLSGIVEAATESRTVEVTSPFEKPQPLMPDEAANLLAGVPARSESAGLSII